MPGTKSGAAIREQKKEAEIYAKAKAQIEKELAEKKAVKRQQKQAKPQLLKAVGKAKGRGIKPVGNVAEALEGKADKASVKIKRGEISNSIIAEYRKELEDKKAKIERNLQILDSNEIY